MSRAARRADPRRREEPLGALLPAEPAVPGIAALLDLQRTAGNQAVQRVLAGPAARGGMLLRQGPAPPAVAGAVINPMPAVNAISAWRIKAEDVIQATADWETDNWIEFLSRTSSNPRLTMADHELASVASNFIGNVFSGGGERIIAATGQRTAAGLGALIGTAVGPGAGTVIGFLLGVLVESVSSFIFENVTGKADPAEKAADAAERVGKLIQRQHALLAAQRSKADAALEELVAAANSRAEHAQSQAEVEELAAWAVEAADKTLVPQFGSGYPMATDLLEAWVLEHAGDLDTPHGGDVDSTQWQRAMTSVFGDLDEQPVMFAYQTRAEWERAGIQHEGETSRMLTAAEELWTQEGFLAGDAVQAAFHDRTYEFSSFKSAEALRDYIMDHNLWTAVGAEWLLTKIKAGDVRAFCTLDVHSAEGSAHIDEWNWRYEIAMEPGEDPNPGPASDLARRDPAQAGGDTGAAEDTGSSGPLVIAFDVWPTWG